jgi:mRNA interferase RelE/StbE
MESHMLPYAVQLTETAIDNLRRYPRNDQRRIVARIEQLAEAPYAMRNVKRLVDFDVSYRLRVGNYRVLFEIDDEIRVIDVIDVLPRGRAYRRK